jgi:hypothetical protein
MKTSDRTYSLNERFFRDVQSEAQAYVLGFATADGNVGIRCLRFGLKGADQAQLELIRNLMGSNHPVKSKVVWLGVHRKPCPVCELQVNSVALVADLVALGVGPAKALRVRPWEGRADLMPHYWRGIVDGDGGVRQEGGGYRIMLSGNLPMVQGFIRFIEQRTGARGNPEPDKSIYVVRFGRFVTVQAIATTLYGNATYALQRKWAMARTIIHGSRLTKD